MGEAQIPLLWATRSAVAMLGSAPLAGWSDRIGRHRLLVAGYASYGLFLSATEGVEKALVADLALPDERGTALGWFNLVTGLALLPASLLFGGLMQGYGAPAVFAVASAFALLAAALLALMPLGQTLRSSSIAPPMS